jgi:type 1 glutamine amidotransferase
MKHYYKKRNRFLQPASFRALIILIVACFISIYTLAQHKKPIRVLIVDGFSNHDWKQTTLVTKWILEKANLFKVDISTVPADSVEWAAWNPDFSKYAVVIQNTNNVHNSKLRWPRRAELALEDYVRKGGGLYALHSANNAFAHWAAYNKMIGIGWRPDSVGYAPEIGADESVVYLGPGQGKGTNHGNRFNAIVNILKEHPINKGYPKRWQTANTEVYNYPRGPAENCTILSYAYDSSSTKKMWPVEWVVAYGKGRVYSSSMGHLWKGDIYPPGYRCAGFQTTMIRVTEWLATGKVTFPVPADFPSSNAISLRNEHEFLEQQVPAR